MSDEFISPIKEHGLLLAVVAAIIIGVTSLVLSFSALRRASSAITGANKARDLSNAAFSKYEVLESSWSQVAITVSQIEMMKNEEFYPKAGPVQQLSQAYQDLEKEQKTIWQSIKKIIYRQKKLETKQNALANQVLNAVNTRTSEDQVDYYQEEVHPKAQEIPK